MLAGENLIFQHPAVVLYRGETVPLRCRYRFQTDLTTAAFYRNGALIVTDPNQRKLIMSENAVEISLLLLSDSSYTCRLNGVEESPPIMLKVDRKQSCRRRSGRGDVDANSLGCPKCCSIETKGPSENTRSTGGGKHHSDVLRHVITWVDVLLVQRHEEG